MVAVGAEMEVVLDEAGQDGLAVEVKGDGAYAMLPTGHVNAVTRLTVNVDGAPAVTYVLAAPTVLADQVLTLDTSQLSVGQHVITVSAFGVDKNLDGTLASTTTNQGLLIFDDASANKRTITVVR